MPALYEDILLTCLRPRTTEREAAGALSVLHSSDWEEFRRLAGRLGVAPLLHYRLDEIGVGASVPSDVRTMLKRSYQSTAAHNMHAYRELCAICNALSGRDIPVIALKGVFLAPAVYGRLGLRPMRDIDLLVPRECLDSAAAALRHFGYNPLAARDPIDGMEVTEVDQHLPVAFRTGGATAVEIHWSITPPGVPYAIATEGLWERSAPVVLEGAACRGLAPEDLLLHIAMHVAYMHDFGFGLRPFCDIAATVSRYAGEMDWQAVTERARQWGWARGVGAALLLAHEWLDAAIPDDVLRSLVDPEFDSALKAAVRASVFGSAAYRQAELPSASFARMWSAGGLGTRIAALRHAVSLDRRTLARQFGISPSSPWVYFYYPLRLHRLIRRYTPLVARLARGSTSDASLLRSTETVRRWLWSPRPTSVG